MLQRDILANVERGMTGLSRAARGTESVLTGSVAKDAWVTAPKGWFPPKASTTCTATYTVTQAVIESYENGGALVRPHPLPPLTVKPEDAP